MHVNNVLKQLFRIFRYWLTVETQCKVRNPLLDSPKQQMQSEVIDTFNENVSRSCVTKSNNILTELYCCLKSTHPCIFRRVRVLKQSPNALLPAAPQAPTPGIGGVPLRQPPCHLIHLILSVFRLWVWIIAPQV